MLPQKEHRRLSCRDANEAARDGFTIEVRCRDDACGHGRVIDVEPLLRLCAIRRWDTSFVAIGNKLRCGRCRGKFPILTASDQPPQPPPIGPATEAEFRRMVREQRR